MIDFVPETTVDQLVPLFTQANQLAIQLRQQGLVVNHKRDYSMVTNADVAIEQLLTARLQSLYPHIPVVGEEALSQGTQFESSDLYWLIDPIDCTSGYVSGSNEFAISVGLIEQGHAVFGVVCLPSDQMIYMGSVKHQFAIAVDAVGQIHRIAAKTFDIHAPTVLHSRSESGSTIKNLYGSSCRAWPMGSARKFVLMATGQADVYVRTFELSEYDIAGGHALAEAAGCRVRQTNGQPLVYGRPDLQIGSFVVTATDQSLTSTNSASGS